MRPITMLVALALLPAALAAQEVPQQAPPEATAPAPSPDAEVKALEARCSGRTFETSVDIMREGKTRRSRVKLCATAGDTDADWLRTLEDAKVKIGDFAGIDDANRARVRADLDAEIARVRASAKPAK